MCCAGGRIAPGAIRPLDNPPWNALDSDLVYPDAQASGARARSSVGEHPLHTRGVVGSIPTVPMFESERDVAL
jgi:hypothetical protein